MYKSRGETKNFDERNIEFISKPLKAVTNEKSDRKFIIRQRNRPCKVTPAISAMKKSVEFLFM